MIKNLLSILLITIIFSRAVFQQENLRKFLKSKKSVQLNLKTLKTLKTELQTENTELESQNDQLNRLTKRLIKDTTMLGTNL